MSFSLVDSVEGMGASDPVTGAMDTTAGNVKLLVAFACWFNPGDFNDDATGNNIWVPLTARTALTPKSRIFYVIDPKKHAAHVFTFGGPNTFTGLIVQAFTAGGAISFDRESTAEGTATTMSPGSVTPASNGALLVCGHGTGTAADHTIGDGFDETNEVTQVGGVNEGAALAWLEQSIAAAINPTWSGGGNVQRTAHMAVFLEAAVGKGVAFDTAKDTARDTARDTVT